ncbi:MAG: hypothetical protein GTO24_23535 [candidate division Zixibacteria bacterium]|nr:hypothetical protein [candidate division Zixibacteria bacterium]
MKKLSRSQLCLFVVSLGIYVGLINCSEGTKVVEYTGNVEGFVIDSLTRLPIDSAWIGIDPDTLNPPITYTDSTGYYFFTWFTGIHRSHFCGKSGYITKKTGEYRVRKDQTTRADLTELAPLVSGRREDP